MLFFRRWLPEALGAGKNKVVLLIIHGMAEHSGRYAAFAEKLCEHGIETWAFDMRGHGKTANLSLNSAASGGLLGHCADRKAFSKLLGDIESIRAEIEKTCDNPPLFLFGHSFGSFLAQGYIEYTNKRPLAGCILSGTRGPSGAAIAAGAHFLNIYSFFRGRRHLSRFSARVVLGGNNRPFQPTRTPCDWLSRDTGTVDAYINDPLCGTLFSAGFFRDMLWILQKIHNVLMIGKIKKSLPIYIFSGSDDPVGGMGKNVTNLVKRYKQEGIADIELILYPNARHECLHEINSGEVISNIIDWINRHISAD
jgi:alpha-beta hydrolase superfamily lysophospholipase